VMAMMRDDQMRQHLNYISTILRPNHAPCRVKLLSDLAFPIIDTFKKTTWDGNDAM